MNARELVAWNTRRVRVSRGFSSEALAANAGVDRAYVSRIERAVANASIDVLERIARVCSALRWPSYSRFLDLMRSARCRFRVVAAPDRG
jgi:transcriptional regulator with XRE-family HTH domain